MTHKKAVVRALEKELASVAKKIDRLGKKVYSFPLSEAISVEHKAVEASKKAKTIELGLKILNDAQVESEKLKAKAELQIKYREKWTEELLQLESDKSELETELSMISFRAGLRA